MGTWGASLYDDDSASDLKSTLALLCKVPVDGNQLLKLSKRIYGNCEPGDEDGAIFWLVVADQFERRGIECQEVADTALSIIAGGAVLLADEARGADEKILKNRTLVLKALAERLRSPRAFRLRFSPPQPPDLVLQTGEIYAFPTMDGRAWSPYRLESEGSFMPNGWGAMVVLATGRAFEWLPWCAVASLIDNR